MPPEPSRARSWNSPTERGSFGESGSILAPGTLCEFATETTCILHDPPEGTAARVRGDPESRLVAIAHAGLGEQVTRAGRVILQLAAQPGHVEAQVVGPVTEAGSP